MAIEVEQTQRPLSWAERRARIHNGWTTPFHAIEHGAEWLTQHMSNWAFLEALEHLGKFSVLIAVVFYFLETGDRIKQKHYQAWQVINTSQGKGGSGGRIEALHELNNDRVPLVGVDVSGAFLQGVHLNRANLLRANFQSADIRNAMFRRANLTYANLASANLREADLDHADLENATLEGADFNYALLTDAKLAGASLDQADLRNADLRGMDWKKISSIKLADIFGVKNAPAGFIDWAIKNGAVSLESDEAWDARLDSSK